MNTIDQQTSNDLEFDIIRLMLHDHCHGPSAQMRTVDLEPLSNSKEIKKELVKTNEFLRIRTEGHTFPQIRFQELEKELELLAIPNSNLNQESFSHIKNASNLVNDIFDFLKKNTQEFVELPLLLTNVQKTDRIVKLIDEVFDVKGKIQDNASANLSRIRKEIVNTRKSITRNFNQIVKKYREKGWLADTNESYHNDRRLLAVESTYKRRVTGVAMGSSRTGNITYIEPQQNVSLNFELEMLHDDERKEILKILNVLTEKLRGFYDLIEAYNVLLIELDFIQAKTRLAIEMNACMPGISDETKIELINAFHPLLYLNNKKEEVETLPQTLSLDKFSRMLVISGPNAGGKSITLKTVGLLQIMFQSGLMIPVDSNSKLSVFHYILSDIGDNQSIENQLSTYSYRLKRMKLFLEITNKKTLLLLDEFGTGSDPELGGALAEVFFEKLYSKKAFGVITTHYSNIKLKAAQLRNTINGCMLFDRESLEPKFKLALGQPGSSFTFEVAESNGIDKDIIEEAKKKLDKNRVQMDKMLSELQIEKARTVDLNKKYEMGSIESERAKEEFEVKKKSLDEKASKYQDLSELNNQLIRKGKRMEQFIKRYKIRNKNKELLDDMLKFVAIEKTKELDVEKTKKLKEKSKQKKVVKAKQKSHIERIKVGSTVRLSNTRQNGTVLELKGKNCLVAFGNFKTQVEVKKLVWIIG